MKALELSFIILCVLAFASIVKTLDPLLAEVQVLLDTRNPNCVAYRNAVNNYIKAKFPGKMCQLQCNNRDYYYAENFPEWYIPNFLPREPKDCGTKVDDCNYKFDSQYVFGKYFSARLLEADVFITAVLEKSYLVLCQE
jgi:hypothetical protein